MVGKSAETILESFSRSSFSKNLKDAFCGEKLISEEKDFWSGLLEYVVLSDMYLRLIHRKLIS